MGIKPEKPTTIIRLETAEDAKKLLEGTRVQVNYWDEPGYYAIYEYNQRCPRGCCFDDVKEIIHIQDYLRELKTSIREKADTIRHWNSILIKENNMM